MPLTKAQPGHVITPPVGVAQRDDRPCLSTRPSAGADHEVAWADTTAAKQVREPIRISSGKPAQTDRCRRGFRDAVSLTGGNGSPDRGGRNVVRRYRNSRNYHLSLCGVTRGSTCGKLMDAHHFFIAYLGNTLAAAGLLSHWGTLSIQRDKVGYHRAVIVAYSVS